MNTSKVFGTPYKVAKRRLLRGLAPIQFGLLALAAACKAPPPPPLPEGALVHVPADAAGQQVRSVAVAFHGRGDRPDRFIGLFAQVSGPHRVVVLEAPHEWKRSGFSWFETSSSGDSAAFASEAHDRAEALLETLDTVQAHFGVRAEPVVTGFSQGGILSWTLAAEHPEHIGAALPVGGFLPDGLAVKAREVPVTAFHGDLDQVIPVERARSSEARLKASGPVELKVYPGVGHSIPPPMRSDYLEALNAALKGDP